MKNYKLLFIFLLLTNYIKSQPFSYGYYVPYDGYLQSASGYTHSPNSISSSYGHGDYTNRTAAATCYYKYASPAQGNFKKPFVFVEGISFEKPQANSNYISLKNYLLQDEINYPSNLLLYNCLINNQAFEGQMVGYSSFNWATLCMGIDAEGIASGNPLQVQKSPVLLNKLYCAGYDIALVDFVSGQEYIDNNAHALYDLLVQIHNDMVAGGSNQKIVVCGASMGGLVARYAINMLEANGHADWIETFVSFDAPQMGANIPMGLQYTLKHLKGISSDLSDKYNRLTCPSASQLVNYSCLETNLSSPIVYDDAKPSLERTELLNGPYFGWPQHCRKISISNGSRMGYQQSMSHSPGNKILDIDGLINLDIFALPVNQSSYQKVFDFDFAACTSVLFAPLALTGQSVRLRHTMNLDLCSGSYRKDLQEIEGSLNSILLSLFGIYSFPCTFDFDNIDVVNQTCFIPTCSSMGLHNYQNILGAGPINEQIILQNLFNGNDHFYDPYHQVSSFDVVYAPVFNQSHVEITDDNIQWLMNELLGKPTILFQDEIVSSNEYKAEYYIKAGKNVGKYASCGALLSSYTTHSLEYYPQSQYTLANPPYNPTDPDITVTLNGWINQGGTIVGEWDIAQDHTIYDKCAPVIIPQNAVVYFKAGDYISLEPGFETQPGAFFQAEIIPVTHCASGARMAPPTVTNGNALPQKQSSNFINKEKIPKNEDQNFVIYPNPATDIITLKSGRAIISAELFNNLGVLVGSESMIYNKQFNLSVADYPEGIYLLKVKIEDGELTHKIVVQHN